ncbi:MAG: CsbD family protein [Candidatus Sulfotelmatobacter sp.]
MNKDRVEGKLKDVGGRVERQVGEWTGDADKQAHGTAKQAEGKVQNAWGKVKDAGKKAVDKSTAGHDQDDSDVVEEKEIRTTRRKVS